MDFQIPIQLPNFPDKISYQDRLLLTGSCFTEHIGDYLAELKFDLLQNPNGILFDPYSVAESLVSYIRPEVYTADDLVFFNELWQSWKHHSRFSAIHPEDCLQKINAAQQQAHQQLKKAEWLIITLGSSFSYRLTELASQPARGSGVGTPVANCHRAPAQWFRKHMMTIEETTALLDNCLHQLFRFNAGLKVVFTISPVRHIRDGVIENNRSKARLIETVHHLVQKFDRLYYFPAYEMVIDVLRDYRFYDLDMVHPNYAATRYVMEQFSLHCIDPTSRDLATAVQQIVTARKHKAFQPETEAHKKFLKIHADKTRQLMAQYPFLDLNEELNYFSQ
jgi:GSCFA family